MERDEEVESEGRDKRGGGGMNNYEKRLKKTKYPLPKFGSTLREHDD